MFRRPPSSQLFPYTSLFRSYGGNGGKWGGYSLPEGSGSEFFIFIFGALRSKDAIKISAPRAARQGPPPRLLLTRRVWIGGFYLYFSKDKNKDGAPQTVLRQVVRGVVRGSEALHSRVFIWTAGLAGTGVYASPDPWALGPGPPSLQKFFPYGTGPRYKQMGPPCDKPL